jgi:hypothetical protein
MKKKDTRKRKNGISTNLSLPVQVESLLPIEISVVLRGRKGEIGGWRRVVSSS